MAGADGVRGPQNARQKVLAVLHRNADENARGLCEAQLIFISATSTSVYIGR